VGDNRWCRLTPAERDVPADSAVLGEDGNKEQRVQVETLDEDPRVVGGRRVVEQRHQHSTPPHLTPARQPRSLYGKGTRTILRSICPCVCPSLYLFVT